MVNSGFSITEQLKRVSSINSKLTDSELSVSHHGNSARQKEFCIFLTSRTVLAWEKIVAGVNA